VARTIEVQVERDYLERLAASKSPLAAVEELIWNSLDADATVVRVKFGLNAMGGLESIEVSDNGRGLPHTEAIAAFERLGGSWKRTRRRSKGHRVLHGQQGKGRFQAFALGSHVEWSTRYKEKGELFEYLITGSKANLRLFSVEEPRPARGSATGTVATITGIERRLTSLEPSRARQPLAEEFALYLRQYSGISILYDGQIVDPVAIEEKLTDYPLPSIVLPDGQIIEASLTVVEWKVATERALFLCDSDGFSLHKLPPGIQAPGFNFTAYLKSSFIRDLWEAGELALEELSPDLKPLTDSAKDQLKDHFRKRAAERAGNLVEHWKEERIYPYEGSPKSVVEEAERQVFDVLALNVHHYLPEFGITSRENRQFSFRLLRTAIEASPEAVQMILQDVLNLPKEKQEELALLLERTSLEAIINASKVVADRLDFLQGLELLVFDPIGKECTLERSHLHKIIADHTWLFGEEFNLTLSDRSLNAVLRRHLDLNRVELLDEAPVLREDGSHGIVDLMLSRLVPQPRKDQNEHLIVELKRPNVSIGSAEAQQVKDYAIAIVRDDRFRDTNTRWEFWAVSSEVSDSVRLEANQAGRPLGLLWHVEEYRLKIWVKTWGQIIDACRARLRFFQERLNYVADEGSGLEYLHQVHEKYLPKALLQTQEQEDTEKEAGMSDGSAPE
jgi:Histidine kinase-, DNA gyrase B-, and HSP90-like ATPase